MRYLAAFARTGDPNQATGTPLPVWEPWDAAEGGFKALVMDVDGDAPRFSVLRDSPSLAWIRAQAPVWEGSGALGLLEEIVE
jgi:hypothetical protein